MPNLLSPSGGRHGAHARCLGRSPVDEERGARGPCPPGARAAVSCDDAVLSGTPCIKGTRIPAHGIADSLPMDTAPMQSARPSHTSRRIGSSLPPSMPAPIRGAVGRGARRSGAAGSWRRHRGPPSMRCLPPVEVPDRRVPEPQPGNDSEGARIASSGYPFQCENRRPGPWVRPPMTQPARDPAHSQRPSTRQYCRRCVAPARATAPRSSRRRSPRSRRRAGRG